MNDEQINKIVMFLLALVLVGMTLALLAFGIIMGLEMHASLSPT